MRRVLKAAALFILIATFIPLANGCKKATDQNESQSLLNLPDRVILYDGGRSKEVNKDDKEFAKIVKLTNERIDSKKLSTTLDIIDDEIIDRKKREVIAVEFIYDKEQQLNVKGDGFNPIKYNRLFFELYDQLSSVKPGEKENTVFQYGDLNHYKDSSRGPLKESTELLNMVEGFFK